MKLLVVAATEAEITPMLKHFDLSSGNFITTEHFDVLVTGVGMVATAFALGQTLSTTYKMIINVGIAGSFDRSIALGELVNVTQDIFAELGAEDHEKFITLAELGFGQHIFSAPASIDLPLKTVKGITVNKVHGNSQSIAKITQLYHPQVESMEGAAVFYASHQLHIPVIQVRSISNYVEPRNRESWQIGLAIKNLNDWLIKLLKNDLN